LGVAQLSKVTVIAPRSDYQNVLTDLAKFEEFHLVKDKAPAFDPATEELAIRAVRLYAQLDQVVRDLGIPLKPGMLDFIFRGAEIPQTTYSARDWESLLAKAELEAEPILAEIKKYQNMLAQLQKEESDRAELLSTLEAVSNISTDLGLASKLTRMRVFLAIADKKILPELQKSLVDVIFLYQPVGQDRALVFIASTATEFSKVDKAVRVFELKPLVLPPNLPQSPTDAYKELTEDLKTVSQQRAETEQQLEKVKVENEDKLLALREIAQSANVVLDEVRSSGGLKRVAAISGFIPADRESEFTKDFGEWMVAVDRPHVDHEHSDLPVLMRNPGPTKAFELITENQGFPGHAEVDPTPLVAFVFPIFYGMMFGDLGHGIVVSAFSLLLLRAKDASLRSWGLIFLTAGISASVFGFLFGEFFGFDFKLIIQKPPLLELVDRTGAQPTLSSNAVYTLLIIALLIGMVHLTLAMSLGIVKKIKEHETAELLLDSIPSLVMYISGIFFALSFIGANFVLSNILTSTNPVPGLGIQTATLGLISMVVVLSSVIVIALGKGIATILHKWHETSVADAFIGGVIEVLVKVAEFLSNTISYARLAILLFVHASLLIALNLFTQWGVVGFVPIAILNIFIILLEGMIVYIQDLRLHLYEFFTKFYEGTGSPFRKLLPQRIRTKINWAST
jgi:V/A-type H+-transporting ATPase subunit I